MESTATASALGFLYSRFPQFTERYRKDAQPSEWERTATCTPPSWANGSYISNKTLYEHKAACAIFAAAAALQGVRSFLVLIIPRGEVAPAPHRPKLVGNSGKLEHWIRDVLKMRTFVAVVDNETPLLPKLGLFAAFP